MCGITGFVNRSGTYSQNELTNIVAHMADRLIHRGPDDSGTWVDENSGVALGFRRLSIVDLLPTGHQPMLSADGRFVIVYNGEIYNFLELKTELSGMGVSFKGTSDTEVMLASICQWGLAEAVKKFNGMFAFAVWDRQEKCLSLVRDRIGIKPLYYGWMGTTFLFGSELKALAAHPNFRAIINRDAVASFLRFGYIPTPLSIYKDIHKLEPGTIMNIAISDAPGANRKLRYYSTRGAVEASLQSPFQGDEQEAAAELDFLIRRSVRERMIADVPLGAFLSGGVDSSTIVALMQTQSTQPVKTFTIGFREKDFNEAEYANAVACHLKTDHTELYVDADKAMDVIPRLPTLYDEPFADSSQIPTFLVAELTRRSVTVSLSGDGGDELFAGYNRYFWARKIWGSISWLSVRNRQRASQFVQGLLQQDWLVNSIGQVLPARFRQPNLSDKIKKIAEIITIENRQQLYRSLVSHWKDPQSLVLSGIEPETILTDQSQWPSGMDFTKLMMYLDLVTYLPDDILVKLDRASMGVSLEARVPFLDDQRIIEFAWRLPLSMKIRGNQGKQILRRVLYQYVPKNLIERPKMGFGLPIGTWLRGPLRDWAEGFLDENRLVMEGFFNPKPIRQKWDEHLAKKNNWQYYLWDILMFQAWLETQKKSGIL